MRHNYHKTFTLTMNKKLPHILALLATAATLALGSCKDDSFSLEARIEGLGDQEVQIVYATIDGVQSQSVTAVEDVIKYEGYAPQVTMVNLVMPNGMPTIRTVAVNGDNLKLQGILGSPYPTKVKGGDIAKEWHGFMSEHLNEAERNATDGALNPIIAEFVANNPNNVLSTLLLIYEYAPLCNNDMTDSLLNIINSEAKPLYMLSTYNALRNELNKANRSRGFYQFTLPTSEGDWETFTRPSNGYALIWAWSIDDRDRRHNVDSIKRLKDLYGKRFAVNTLFLDADTSRWRNRIKADSTTWTHYWVPGGPNNPSIKSLGLIRTPYYLLIDSFGANPYRGNSLADIEKMINERDKERKNITLIR